MLAGPAAALYTAKREGGIDVGTVPAEWAAARDTPSPFLVAALGVDPKAPSTLSVVGSGQGGLAGLVASQLLGDGDVRFGAFAFWAGGRQRFAFFSWVGPSVGGMKRGKVSLQRAGVALAFTGTAGDLTWAGAEDLGVDAVEAKLVRGGAADVTLSPPV